MEFVSDAIPGPGQYNPRVTIKFKENIKDFFSKFNQRLKKVE